MVGNSVSFIYLRRPPWTSLILVSGLQLRKDSSHFVILYFYSLVLNPKLWPASMGTSIINIQRDSRPTLLMSLATTTALADPELL